jgi:hypothetical protein
MPSGGGNPVDWVTMSLPEQMVNFIKPERSLEAGSVASMVLSTSRPAVYLKASAWMD